MLHPPWQVSEVVRRQRYLNCSVVIAQQRVGSAKPKRGDGFIHSGCCRPVRRYEFSNGKMVESGQKSVDFWAKSWGVSFDCFMTQDTFAFLEVKSSSRIMHREATFYYLQQKLIGQADLFLDSHIPLCSSLSKEGLPDFSRDETTYRMVPMISHLVIHQRFSEVIG